MFDGRCLIGTGVRLRTFGISSDKKRLYSCHFMLQVATAPEAAGVAAKPVAQDWTTEVNDSLHWSMCRRWNWLHNILAGVVRLHFKTKFFMLCVYLQGTAEFFQPLSQALQQSQGLPVSQVCNLYMQSFLHLITCANVMCLACHNFGIKWCGVNGVPFASCSRP